MKWVFPEKVPQKLLNGVYRNYTELEATLLYNRGIRDLEEVVNFFNTDLAVTEILTSLYDVQKAAEQIIEAVKNGKKIYIYGDYDADGISATAILWEFIYKELPEHINKKVEVLPYIPSRVDEGYGLSEKALEKLVKQDAEMIVTVDCGIRDRDVIKKICKSSELSEEDFIITDHHTPPKDLLDDLDYTVVHPMYPGKEFKQQKISGAAVAFFLMQAIKKELGLDWTVHEDTRGLDLVALSTVTDIMPLKGINRILVANGLKQINSGQRLGLNKLTEVADLNLGGIDTYHLGFLLGPRINAAGRIGDPMKALKLLVTDNEKSAVEYAKELNKLNYRRQDLTDTILKEADKQVNKDSKMIFVHGEGWDEGIVGLVAGKLQEKYYLPTLAATVRKEGDEIVEVRGSARSIKGFNIVDSIEKFADTLEKYGGHAQAAGFSVKPERLEDFKKGLTEYANGKIDDDLLIPKLKVDLEIDTDDLTLYLVDMLDKFAPFGVGNRKPQVCIRKAVIMEKQPLGKKKDLEGRPKHMKIKFKGGGVGTSEAIMFGCKDSWDNMKEDQVVDLVGYAQRNEWNDRTYLQFQIKNWRESSL